MRFTKRTNSTYSNKMLSGSLENHSKLPQTEETLTLLESYLQTISSAELQKLPLVLVEWYDAVCVGGSEWQGFDDVVEALSKGPSLIRSVGFLVENNSTFLALVDTMAVDGDVTGYVHIIPKGMVFKLYNLTIQG